MRAVRQSVRGPVQPARAHDDPLGRQELRVPLVPQVVRAQVVPEQAPGGGLRPGGGRLGHFVVVVGVVVVPVFAATATAARRPRHGHPGRITPSSGAAAADAPADVRHTVRRRHGRRRRPTVGLMQQQPPSK